jgi:membrane-associated phospholipid phosphatase
VNHRLVAAGLGLAAVLLVLLIGLNQGAPLPGDVAITRAVQRALPYERGGALLAGLDDLIYVVAALVLVALLALRRFGAAAFVALVGGTGYLAGDYLLKPLLARPRPSPDLVQVYVDATGFGLPSTTTLCAVLVLGALLVATRQAAPGRLRRWLWAVSLATIAIISVSRIYAGAHWSSDVLASWLLGTGWLALLMEATARWRAPREAAPRTT